MKSFLIRHQAFLDTLPLIDKIEEKANEDIFNYISCIFFKHYYPHRITNYHNLNLGVLEFYKEAGIDDDSYHPETLNNLLFICGAQTNLFVTNIYKEAPVKIWNRIMLIKSVIDPKKLYDIRQSLISQIDDSIYHYNKKPNIIVDEPEVFDDVLEFNMGHPRYKLIIEKLLKKEISII